MDFFEKIELFSHIASRDTSSRWKTFFFYVSHKLDYYS